MIDQSVEFIATGTARDVSHAVEQFAHAQGRVSAIVVPWEGTATTVSMSVTAVRADGWAIEHLNLGTITLTDRADGTTAVAVAAVAITANARGQKTWGRCSIPNAELSIFYPNGKQKIQATRIVAGSLQAPANSNEAPAW